MRLNLSEEVSGARHFDNPMVALESTVIAHGLPSPQNLETARRLEDLVRAGGATPATIAVFDGEACVGLSDEQLIRLADANNIRKLSIRDLGIAAAQKSNGATTVATTLRLANKATIKVFATGGIGGVHRGADNDVSADLPELARIPMIVVCSGAKMILDLPATREWLETYGITVLGWQCDEFPAFYSRTSGLPIDARVDTAREVTAIAEANQKLGLNNSILVTVPVPEQYEIPAVELEAILANALRLAAEQGIKGKEITPFLLSEMAKQSGGRTLASNIALLENNARVAAQIACAF